ncbi:MAG TPA: PqiC family protein [Candidatus Binataceae bacterium]|nr:PqiC family protein [Candidatus Binataceae bacterium]
MIRWLILAVFGLLSLAAGCSLTSPVPDLSKYYFLTATAPPAAAPVTRHPLMIGLGPVNLPGYLAGHNEIATRIGPNQLSFSPTDRWAEPMDQNFKNVLARDLGQLTGGSIVQFPWYNPSTLGYQLELDVTRFDTNESGVATLSARWVISDPRSGRQLLVRESTLTQAAASTSTAAEVAALSQTVSALSQAIANAIVQLQARNVQLSNGD